MADENVKDQIIDNDQQQAAPETDPQPKGLGMLAWILMAIIVVAGSAGGYGLARLLAGSDQNSDITVEEQVKHEETDELLIPEDEDGKSWVYKLEPMVANLDEPGVTRFIRVTAILSMSEQLDETKGTEFLEEKLPAVRNLLTTYLAGLSLERVRGERNQMRVKMEMRERLNNLLFPTGKPLIKEVLTQEFVIQ